MMVAFATVVSLNALNDKETSAAKNTPPRAHALIVGQRSRRPVARRASA